MEVLALCALCESKHIKGKVRVDGSITEFLCDPGSDVTFLAKVEFYRLNQSRVTPKLLKKSKIRKIKTACLENLRIIGAIKVNKITFGAGALTNVTILVADNIESTKMIVDLDMMERIPEFKRTIDELSKKVSMPFPYLSEPEVRIENTDEEKIIFTGIDESRKEPESIIETVQSETTSQETKLNDEDGFSKQGREI